MHQPLRAALAVTPVTRHLSRNLTEIFQTMKKASKNGSSLVLLGEMALTGKINNDIPLHDLPYAETVNDPIIRRLAEAARKSKLWLAFGLLEREGTAFYDTALLLSPDGDLTLQYRRIHPGWHGAQAPAFYCQGSSLQKVETDFGSVLFLIGNDVFDEDLQRQAHDLKPDWVLHPFAGRFADKSRDQERWEKEELPKYEKCVRSIGAPLLAAGYLWKDKYSAEADAYGGAMVFNGEGKLISSLPLDQAGPLYFEAENCL